MYDDRTNLAQQVTETLREYFHDRLFRTVIPRNVRLAEAPSHGKPVALYDPRSRGTEAYFELAGEFLARNRHRESAQRRAQSRVEPQPGNRPERGPFLAILLTRLPIGSVDRDSPQNSPRTPARAISESPGGSHAGIEDFEP